MRKEESPGKRKISKATVIALGGALLVSIVLAASLMSPFPVAYLASGTLVREAPANKSYVQDIEGVRFAGVTGNHIDDSIYYMGAWELHVLHALRDFITATSGREGVFLDIGANVGQHSLYMSKYARKVLAIEPFPPVLERFRSLIQLNGFNNIQVFPVGYSDSPGELPFYVPPESNHGTGSFDASFSEANTLSETLPLVVGDMHLRGAGEDQIDLIKVDIEGFERYALNGLAQTIRTNRPVIVFELNTTEGGFRSEEQLRNTFPPSYDFFYLRVDQSDCSASFYTVKAGPYLYIFGPKVEGRYEMLPFDFSFESQADLVAVPVEKRKLLANMRGEKRRDEKL